MSANKIRLRKSLVVLPLIVIASATGHAASLQAATRSRTRPITVERSEQWTMTSRDNRVFEVSVAMPAHPAPKQGYPVFYVLDPDTAFETLVETTRSQEDLFGPVVVVGVGYSSQAETANRRFDLTLPADVSRLPPAGPDGWGPVGGAEAFYRFIQQELRPMIEARSQLDPSRQALFGHSLGGLFVLHVLFSHPEAFSVYIAASPSIWWGDRAILGELPGFIQKQSRHEAPRRLLLSVGELENQLNPEERRAAEAMNLSDYDEQVHRIGMVGNAQMLVSRLEPLRRHGLDLSLVVFPGETHNSVIPAYLGRGARFASNGWQ